MKKIKLVFTIILMLCMSAVSIFAEVDMKKMKIAVIWNPNTQNTDAPLGWNVGGDSYYPISGGPEGSGSDWQWRQVSKEAPEISKAQLKFFLSAINPDLSTTGTLDTTYTPEYGTPWALGLENIRIYSSDDGVTYERIKDDFDHSKPNAIVYIGAGAEMSENKTEMFNLFRTAAADNVGIMFIGQRSVTDARDLDPDKTTFPIMGVQRKFSIKQFGDGHYGEYGYGDVVKEFDFLKTNNYTDNYGQWDIADTVTLHGNDYQGYKIYHVKDGKVDTDRPIYESNGRVIEDGDTVWRGTGIWRDDVIDEKPSIIHRYGEWRINAKAVEVIEIDTYEAEMNWGFHREKDVWLGYYNGDVYMRVGSPSLFLNGEEYIKAPTTANNAPNLTKNYGLIFDADRGVVAYDWIVQRQNPESGATDLIVVIHAGQPIGTISSPDPDINGDYDKGNYIHMFNAGGLRDLRITMRDVNSSIYKSIFTHPDIKGKTELKFKPYGSGAGENGRLQAGASIWAFNEKLDISSFSALLDGGGGFNRSKYYVDYLGDQVAGRPTNTRAQFVRPHESMGNPGQGGDFWAVTNNLRESELPATNPSRNPYYDNFKDKIFHQIAVAQHGRQRLAMLGYQPTYLEDVAASRAILHDIAKWIGYDQYSLPTPNIEIEENGDRVDADGKYILTSERSIWVVFDGALMGEEMKKVEHTLKAELNYGNQKAERSEKIKVDEDGKVWIEFDLQGNDIIIIPNNGNDTIITIIARAEANAGSIFANSDEITATVIFKKLNIDANVGGQKLEPNKEYRSNDTLTVDTYWRNDNVDGNVKVIVEDDKGRVVLDTIFKSGGKIPFSDLPSGDLKITIEAEADGYVNSKKEEIFPVKNNPDIYPPKIEDAYYLFGDTNKPDTLRILFSESTDYNKIEKQVFYLWRNNVNYPVKVEPIGIPIDRNDGKQEWTFLIVDGKPEYSEPKKGDLINITPMAEVHDKFYNYIDYNNWENPEINPKVELKITKKFRLNMSVITVKNWSDETLNEAFPGYLEKVTTVKETGDAVAIAVLDPGGINVGEDDVQLKSAIIIDPVGNKVIETSGIEEGEHLKAMFVKMGSTGKPVLAISWDGKNTNGRRVGAGAYKLFVVTQWPGTNDNSEQLTSSLIYVPRK